MSMWRPSYKFAATEYQKGSPVSSFNPETDITWHSLFWVEGTAMTAQGYNDTDPVGTWPNETGETNATQATASLKPTYDAVNANFNNKPVVTFDGSDDYIQTGNFSTLPSYASGLSYVAIMRFKVATGAQKNWLDGTIGAGTGRNTLYKSGTHELQIWAETYWTGTVTATTAPILWVAWFDGSTGADKDWINGTIDANLNVGSTQIGGLSIGATGVDGSLPGDVDVAFVGLYEGDFNADPEYANFKSWANTHYGLSVV